MEDNENQHIDLTPMLDVVFIMLIFFIVTATFVKLPGQEVERPYAKYSEKVKPSILAAVDRDSNIWINGKKVNKSAVSSALSILVEENPKGEVVIQADKQSKISQVALIADVSRKLGVNFITIATE